MNQMDNHDIFAEVCYMYVKTESEELDSIYEDYIIRLVGIKGLYSMIDHKFIETWGVVNGRQLYVLCK